MEEKMNIRESIVKTGAVLEGKYFFALKNGDVACKYINIDPVLTYPSLLNIIVSEMVTPFIGKGCTALSGPAVGGIPLTYMGSRVLGLYTESDAHRTRIAFPEKDSDGIFAFQRMGFAEAMQDQKVLILEDITTTGGSTKATIDLVRQSGGQITGVSVIWNRGNVSADTLGVPEFRSLITEPIDTWKPGDHPMWGKWPLVDDIGHPKKFPDYPGERISLFAA